ncbi:MAG: phosphatidate cytidylyltransferase [Pseudomonadota bacterium]|nr:phosphatidate cytidylyltransferase [Pseudomonadota bacterium]
MTRTRVIAALILAPVAVAAILLLPTPWMVALAALVFLVGLWEWFRLADIDDTLARTALLVVNMALMVAIVWGSRTSSGFSYVLLQLMTVLGVIWWLLAMLWLKHFDFGSDHAGYARAYKLAAGTLAIVPAWCALGVLHGGDPNGHRWLLVALASVWAADTGAYFAGRRYGKRKLAPRISPNKTVEGAIGGLAAALLAALVLAPFAGASLGQLALVAVVTLFAAAFSVVGDLFESLLKRHVGAKDSGDLIPGHGGILDRIDGVVAALPVFALGKAWLGF